MAVVSNFEFLKNKAEYAMFAPAAIEAEKVYNSSYNMCAIGCRKALELAVKWLYQIESDLKIPYKDNLSSLIYHDDFIKMLPRPTWLKLTYIVKLGNFSVHTTQSVKATEALAVLKGLYEFIDWIDYCYGKEYDEHTFDEKAIPKTHVELDEAKIKAQESLLKEQKDQLEELQQKLAKMQEELQKQKEQNKKANEAKPFEPEDLSEFKTRKQFIDLDLMIAGWSVPESADDYSKDVVIEYPVHDMRGIQGEEGFVDYVLWGKDGLPLAVVEAKRTSKDPKVGERQAELYAECLERKFGRLPCIFYTNGFITHFWDKKTGIPRQVSSVFSKDDLEKIINRRTLAHDPGLEKIDEDITGRNYQIKAIRALCDAVREKKRKHLFVMATGSGKTRTAASVVDVLARANNITNVLFLADRIALVKQARDAFNEYLPSMSLCNLCSNKDDYNARIVFSTYPTILNAIDGARDDKNNRLYTPAHFDLIIIDEAHRSIFHKYKAIFQYFDAMLLGLTATPKEEVERNTYEFFDLRDYMPTSAYDYDDAIAEHYLVPYKNFEITTKFLHEGIHYDELSEEDKKRYNDDFVDDEGNVPDYIPSTKLNKYIFNKDTIDLVINNLMTRGIKVNGGDRLGKTIIFAQNKDHAKVIVDRFNELYPQYNGEFARRIVCGDAYAQSLIDDFKVADKYPIIAVSVDMLDTGVDVPECTNLVFFKQVFSKTKFWQMIGRGTRLCPDLNCVDVTAYPDKKYFYIFDYCGNFEFFRTNEDGIEGNSAYTLTENIFRKQVALIEALQDSHFIDDKYQDIRKGLVKTCNGQIQALNPEQVAVRLAREYVEKYTPVGRFQYLEKGDVKELWDNIAGLVYNPDEDDYAKNFDNFMYGLMIAHIQQLKTFARSKNMLKNNCEKLLNKTTIPQVKDKVDKIKEVLADEYWQAEDIALFEKTRVELRDLIKFLYDKKKKKLILTDLEDPVLSDVEGTPLEATDNFEDYRKKVNKYIEENTNNAAIYKLTHNTPLTEYELQGLQEVFLKNLGTEEDYRREFKDTALGIMIRQAVTMDEDSVRAAFATFSNENKLTSYQMQFLEAVIKYIRVNGYIADLGALSRAPFSTGVPFMRAFNKEQRKALVSIIQSFERNAVQTA